MSNTLYDILEVATAASSETIKAVYISLIKRFHPDVAGEEGLRRTQEINAAYDILSNPDRREAYDLEIGRKAPDAAVAEPPLDAAEAPAQPQPPDDERRSTVQAEVVVSPGDGYVIGAAIANAAPGTIIRVLPGIYRECLTLDREIEIVGEGSRDTIVIESTDGSCVEMHTERASIRGLTLRAKAGEIGNFANGVAITRGQLVIEDCDISSDSWSNVHADGADTNLIMRGCRLHHGNECGINFTDAAKGTIEGCEINSNGTNFPAGINVREGADPTVRDCTICEENGYGVLVTGARGTFENCEIRGCTTAGVFITEQGDPVFRDCTIHDTRSSNEILGCGVWISDHGRGTFEHCEIANTPHAGVKITGQSGPVFADCNIHGHVLGVLADEESGGTFIDCDIANCSLVSVGVYTQSHPTFRGCSLHQSQTGASFVSGGSGELVDCQIFDMTDRGVMIVEAGNPVFRNCQIYNNAKFGVGNWEGGNGVFENCDIFNNRDSGVALQSGAGTIIRHCNIRQNAELGVFASDGARGTVEYCNLTGNGKGPILVHKASTTQHGNRTDGITVHYTGR